MTAWNDTGMERREAVLRYANAIRRHLVARLSAQHGVGTADAVDLAELLMLEASRACTPWERLAAEHIARRDCRDLAVALRRSGYHSGSIARRSGIPVI